MNKVFLLALACITIAGASVSQAQPQQQSLQAAAPEIVMIKAKLALGDVKAVHKFIDGVEIRGTEVEAFLDVKKTLAKAIESAGSKKDEDQIVLEMRLDAANNFYVLMQRATLKGAEAEKYRQIIAAIQDAAKEAQSKK